MPQTDSSLNILFDRKKLRNELFNSVVFFILGLFYLLMPWINPPSFFLKYYFGCLFILAALIRMFYVLKKWTTHRTAFLIDSTGLHDSYGILGADPILWTDILKIRMRTFLWEKKIVIDVKNAQEHINKQRNWPKKMKMSLNHIFYGSPFCITSCDLVCSLNELFEEITRAFNNNRQV